MSSSAITRFVGIWPGNPGFQILSSTPGGVAQFYDRDMTKEMADEGMKGMQQFYSDPNQIDAILNRLEQFRQRIYKK